MIYPVAEHHASWPGLATDLDSRGPVSRTFGSVRVPDLMGFPNRNFRPAGTLRQSLTVLRVSLNGKERPRRLALLIAWVSGAGPLNGDFDAAILRPALGCVVGGDRTRVADPLG